MRWASERTAWLAALAGALLLAGVHIVWLLHFRSGYVTEWDESGYISLALDDTRGLQGDGPLGLAEAVLGEGIQAPLVPLSAVPLQVLFGESVDASLAAIPLFSIVLVLATFGLARRLGATTGWAALAALCVGTAPVVVDYTRLFHFALPAAALATSALWALLCSEGLSRRGCAIGFGALVGAMTLARTMTLAFVPGFAVAALVLALAPADRRRDRLLNLVLAGVAAATVAGSWYIPNLRSVGHYLLNFGYGAESSAYGERHSPISIEFWTRELEGLLDALYLPLAVALAIALATGIWLAIRAGRPRLRTSAVTVAVVLFVAAGYVAVSSSRNVGTAFALPWIPALIALAVAAVGALPSRAVRSSFAALLIVVSVTNLVMKSGGVEALAEPTRLDLPLAGQTTVLDGRSLIYDEIEGAGYELPNPADRIPALHRRWLPTARELSVFADRRARSRGTEPRIALGFDDLLFSNTRVRLAAELALDRSVQIVFLKPFPDGDTARSYRRQLVETRTNLLVTGRRKAGIHPSITVTRSEVETAARTLGFRPVRRFPLPDGRPILLWGK